MSDQTKGKGAVSSRRKFMVGSAAAAGVAAAGALSSCAGDKSCSLPDKWDKETDVLVIGGGGAGLAAAIEAGKSGSQVMVLEKGVAVGGDTFICDGFLAGHGTRLTKANGVDVTTEEVQKHFDSVSFPAIYGDKNKPIEKIVIEKAGETIDWLESLGVPFEPKVGPDPNYTALPIIHYVSGRGSGFSKPLTKAVKDAGVEIMLDCRATRLIVDDSGRVVGVAAQLNGKTVHVKSRKATVLATGNYSANGEMMAAFNPMFKGLGFMSSPGTTGDGLIMAMQTGALTVRTSRTPIIFPTVEVDTRKMIPWQPMQGGGIVVDENGKRFLNEDISYMSGDLPKAILAQIGKQKKTYIWMILVDSPLLTEKAEKHHLKLEKANTVEELAVQAGLDPVSLRATIEQYNTYCANKKDPDFGRQSDLKPLNPPYYVIKVRSGAVVTVGGLKTDMSARVLKFGAVGQDGGAVEQVIPGLYAAGTITEWNAAGAWTVGSAFTFGRIAGKNASAEKPLA